MRKIILIAFISALSGSPAFAQCSGQPGAGLLCANPTASNALPTWTSQSSVLDRNFGAPSVQGTILNRGASLWSATATPSLGKNGGTGGSVTLNGATSGSAVLAVKAAAGTVTFNLPITNGSLNNVLVTDGAGNTSWTAAGGGTVSSVGLSMPGIFTVTNSPVTSTGTLTATLNTQSANLIWAGPNTGSAAQPTFRSLVGADLPNPSASSLGGVQSVAAITSNWIRSISTSGVPALSQPAFTDISGSITPAQCPNPSATTTGCIESYVAVANQWINSISTSGVPSSTQPNFSNIAGNATLSQLPSISNNSVLANNSGGTGVPSAISASNVLDMVGSTQGDILYRGASGWSVLAPSTNGFVLTTGGPSANPVWANPSSGGTVTSIATNNGVTGGTITTTGTIGLAAIATGNVLAYTSGGTGVPVATAPTTILDIIGSATGDILYRSSGGWTALAPGTNGQVLTQGSTTPSWSNAGSVTNVTVASGTGITNTGTCNISTTGTCTVGLSSARQTLPTTQSFLTAQIGSTYTTPTNALWIEVWACGAGGGGGGSGGGSPTSGGTGGTTTFNSINAAGGTGGAVAVSSNGNSVAGGAGGAGGTGAATFRFSGQGGGGGQGSVTSTLDSVGGTGGSSGHGLGGGAKGIGSASPSGVAPAGNCGGGSGAGSSSGTLNGAGGGGGGEAVYLIINNPTATYTFTVGAAGTAGGAGTGNAGGAGAPGGIWIVEHYGS
jgi:hypothetical protein